MKINLDTVDRERFYVLERSIPDVGPVFLMTPHKAMWAWTDEELHMRSLLCKPDGTVVSSGFPKFFNYGERPADDAIVDQALKDGSVILTEKLDGSLIIRSVIDGVVNFRTRGCEVIAESMHDAVMDLIKRKYPTLLDPKNFACPTTSLLFEYISPNNQIVISYTEPELVALCMTEFSGDELKVYPLSEYYDLYDAGLLPNMRVCDRVTVQGALSGPKLKNHISALTTQKEGVVTWLQKPDGSIMLCKFKSAWYLRLHALRAQCTPRYLKEFCYVNGVSDIEGLKKALLNDGFDWEVVSYIEPMFDEIKHEWDSIDMKVAQYDSMISRSFTRSMSRKEIAVKAQGLTADRDHEMFAYIMAKATGDHARAKDIHDAFKLGISIASLKTLREKGIEKILDEAPDDG